MAEDLSYNQIRRLFYYMSVQNRRAYKYQDIDPYFVRVLTVLV